MKIKKECIILCLLAVIICSCGNNDTSELLQKKLFKENGTVSLSDAITKEYNINDLKNYFKNYKPEGYFNQFKQESEYIYDVDSVFPVEILRPGGYSVYKVKQGGYYFVFWAEDLVLNDDGSYNREEDKRVYSIFSTAYFTHLVNEKNFESITPGISTAQDVYEIDPAFDIVDYLSSGFFSYSLLNEDQLMEIEYEHKGHLTSFEDLIVKSIEVVPRNSINIATRFKAILQDDIVFIEGN